MNGPIVVASIDETGSAARGGVQVGDVLVAVQNVDTTQLDIEEAMGWIARSPQVVNLRFLRGKT